jgi:hypothetical protein
VGVVTLGVGAAAIFGVEAALMTTEALAAAGFGLVSGATAIASGALSQKDPQASKVLGYVSLATGVLGIGAAGLAARAAALATEVAAESGAVAASAVGETGEAIELNDIEPDNAGPLDRVLAARGLSRTDLRALDFDIPDKVYRGSAWRLNFSTIGSEERRLANILEHTASQVGSMGKVQSFSADINIARDFYDAERFGFFGRGSLFEVDTTGFGSFTTVPRLLLERGDQLVSSSLISEHTLDSAVGWAQAANEREIFYVRETPVPGRFVGLQPKFNVLESWPPSS